MNNWAGMKIEPGVPVWRGARRGNSSDFRIGRVIKTYPDKRSARVEWLDDTNDSTCDIDSLAIISEEYYEYYATYRGVFADIMQRYGLNRYSPLPQDVKDEIDDVMVQIEGRPYYADQD